jgi:hypothetical protein
MKKEIRITLSLISLGFIFLLGILFFLNYSPNSNRVAQKIKQLIKNNSCLKEYPLPKLKNLPNDKLSEYKNEVKIMGVQAVNSKTNLKALIKTHKLVPLPFSNWAYALKIRDKDMRFVVPLTRELLYEISTEFKNKISKSDLFNAKLKVTSVFRLKDNNPKNSSKESAHKHGCAIDISYIDFLDQNDQPMNLDGCQLEYLQFSLEKVIEELQAKKKLYKTKEFGSTSKCFHVVPRK